MSEPIETSIMIENAVIAYPHLWEPWAGKDGKGKPKYGCKIIPPANFDWAHFTNLCQIAKQKTFGTNIPLNLREAWSSWDGDDKYKGWSCLSASKYGDEPVQVVDQNVNPIPDRNTIFGGCICNIYIDIYAYNNEGKGVTCGLKYVQLVSNVNVERIGNAGPAITEVFKPIAGAPAAIANHPDMSQQQPQGQQPGPGAPQQQYPQQGQPGPTGVAPGAPQQQYPQQGQPAPQGQQPGPGGPGPGAQQQQQNQPGPGPGQDRWNQ